MTSHGVTLDSTSVERTMLLLNGDQRKGHETDDTEGENDSIVVDTAMLETRCSERERERESVRVRNEQ